VSGVRRGDLVSAQMWAERSQVLAQMRERTSPVQAQRWDGAVSSGAVSSPLPLRLFTPAPAAMSRRIIFHHRGSSLHSTASSRNCRSHSGRPLAPAVALPRPRHRVQQLRCRSRNHCSGIEQQVHCLRGRVPECPPAGPRRHRDRSLALHCVQLHPPGSNGM
jgi:hypothetical protein